MANVSAAQLVAPPARVPAPYGLFSVLAFRDPADRHWEGAGVKWMSFDGSTGLGVIGQLQVEPAEPTGIPKTFTGDVTVDEAGVFTVYGHQKVTPGAWNQAGATDRARDILVGLEQRAVESVLAGVTGSLTQTFDTAMPITSTALIVKAIAELEDFLSDNYGSRGVLHLSRGNAIHALTEGALETRNGGLFTKLGTPVAAGQGYPSTAAYATSALIGYRSDIFDNTGRPYDLLDKSTNDLYAIAERTYCIGFEEAALGAVTITAPA